MASKFIEYLKSWDRSDKNVIIAIVGEARSGKSLAGWILVNKLSDNPKIIYTLEELLDAMENPEYRNNWLLFDEFELECPSIRWYDIRAQILGEIFQSFGYMKINLILTCPHLKYLTAIPRSMIGIIIQMRRQRYGYPYRWKYNLKGDPYPKKYVDKETGQTLHLVFPRLSEDEVNKYKAIKKTKIEQDMMPQWKEILRISKIQDKAKKIQILDKGFIPDFSKT